MKVFSPFLNGDTTTSGSFNVPNHPGTGSIPNPLTGSLFHDDTDGILKIYTGTQWQVVGEQTTPSAGPASADIEYLVTAGGGGGGGRHAGGGGSGGYLSSSLASVASGSSFTVTVGSGGSGGPNGTTTGKKQGTSGTDSTIVGASISTITATAGGGGGGDADDNDGSGLEGLDGGSGGGSSYLNSGGSGTVGQGTDGGNGQGSPYYSGGGGGGAATAGTNASGTQAGAGGTGLVSKITGTAVTKAGGGGAGGWSGVSAGSGGTGGGGTGTGGAGSANATSGTANTGGGGGGGGGESSAGGTGGSGVAIFAYDSGSINAAGGIVGDAGNGRKYHQFNTSDTFKVGSTSDFQIVTSNLVSHFDAGDFTSRGTSTWTDLSGNGYNLTATSSPSLGNNFYYDFSTSYFTRTDSAHEFTNGNFTIEVWVKFDSLSAGDTIASKRNTGNPGTRNWLLGNDTNGQVYFIQYHSSTQNTYPQTGNGVVTTGTWHHITVTGDASTVKIYVDGTQEATTSFTTTGAWGTGSPLELARRGTNSGHKYLDGQIAQFRAYSSGLTASEVLQNYNATKTNFI